MRGERGTTRDGEGGERGSQDTGQGIPQYETIDSDVAYSMHTGHHQPSTHMAHAQQPVERTSTARATDDNRAKGWTSRIPAHIAASAPVKSCVCVCVCVRACVCVWSAPGKSCECVWSAPVKSCECVCGRRLLRAVSV